MPNVNVTYDQMDAAANQLTHGQQEIESQLATLQKLVRQLVQDGYVTDSSSKAFDTSYEEFNTGILKVVGGLEGMSGYLKKASATFRQADTELASALKG